MKTLLFCTSYISNNGGLHHMKRYKRWVDYYYPLLHELQADNMFLIDDCGLHGGQSSFYTIENELPPALNETVNIYRFNTNLGRRSVIDFPGWWRSFLFSLEIAEKYGFDKIIHIESDFFIVSGRLKEYIRDLSNGWSSLFSHYHNFPETAVQVICRDAYSAFYGLKEKMERNNYTAEDFAENILPFTRVEKQFIGDRLGEESILTHWLDHRVAEFSRLDYLGQMVSRYNDDDE